MKKWEQLQLTLRNSKSEEEQGDYQDKTQKLFKTMRFRVMKHEFLKLVPTIFYQSSIFTLNDGPSKAMKNAFYFI